MARKGAPAAMKDKIESLCEEVRAGLAYLESARDEPDPVKRVLLLGAAQRSGGRMQRACLKLKRESRPGAPT